MTLSSPLLWRFLHDMRATVGARLLVALAFTLGVAGLEAGALALIAPLLASVGRAGAAGLGGFMTAGALIGGAWLGRALLAALREEFAGGLGSEVGEMLRERLATALAAAPWQRVVGLNHALIKQALSSDANRAAYGADMVVQTAASLVILAVLAGFALILAPGPAVIALALLALVGGAVGLLVRRAGRLGAALAASNRTLAELAAGFLGGLRLAAAQNLETEFVARFRGELADSVRDQRRYRRQRMVANLGVTLVALGVAGGTALLGTRLFATPAPVLLALLVALARMAGPLGQLQQASQQLAYTLPAYETLTKLLDALVVPAVTVCEAAAPPPPAGPITLERVHFRHAPELPIILDDVTLTIAPGEMVGLAGPSGAGKSTLADLITGILTPEAGQIRVGGAPISGGTARAWRREIAYATQEPVLFHASIRANLCWGAPGVAEDAALWAAIEAAALTERINAAPQGLDTLVGERGALFSGGERQRLALARALLRGGRLLILDEATSALDPATEARIFTALRAAMGQRAVLVIAHRAETLGFCDRVLQLERGRVCEMGRRDG